MNHHPRRLLVAVVPLIAVMVLGACGSDSDSAATSSPEGDKTAFCALNATIDTALSDVTSDEEGIAVLKGFEPQFDQYIADAPKEIEASAETQIATSRSAIASGDPSVFGSDEALAASKAVNTFCDTAVGSVTDATDAPGS